MSNLAHWTNIEFHVGDTIRVHYKLIEHEKVAGKTKREVHEETHERTQVFEGILLAIKGSGVNTMITVRHIGAGAIGVERIFPLVSPWIKKIEVKKKGDVRRAKLYYLRNRLGKEAMRLHEILPGPAASA
ncbi:50S ribosomal protein L19 [Candidatus Gottesmanbacteria bacterium]|nr:50S ribosomal protein L19 [Candidatus Gottesmanbacteria bacterium]